jgi:hypothetical protein
VLGKRPKQSGEKNELFFWPLSHDVVIKISQKVYHIQGLA